MRDAIKKDKSVKIFAEGLYNYAYGKEKLEQRFEDFRDKLSRLVTKVIVQFVALLSSIDSSFSDEALNTLLRS